MKRKLPPYQYKLRFPSFSDFEVPRAQRKNKGYLGGPYLCMVDGKWHLYRNRWKADWDRKWRFMAKRPYRYAHSASLSAPTLQELRLKVIKERDGRYGWHPGIKP